MSMQNHAAITDVHCDKHGKGVTDRLPAAELGWHVRHGNPC